MNADDIQWWIYSAVPMPPTSGRRFKSVIRSIQHLHKKNAKPLNTRPRAYSGSAQIQKPKEKPAVQNGICSAGFCIMPIGCCVISFSLMVPVFIIPLVCLFLAV